MLKRYASLLALFVVCLLAGETAAQAAARWNHPTTPGIWLSGETGRVCEAECQRQLLAGLRRLTGWPQLGFNANGQLAVIDSAEFSAGSPTARAVLGQAWQSGHVFIIEAHTGSPDVSFGQLDEGLIYEDNRRGVRLTIWRVRLDLADFKRISAPARVRAAFDPGFVFLHELLHGLGYPDPNRFGEIGACEARVNQIRAELALPQRAQYFATAQQMYQSVVMVRLGFQEASRAANALGQPAKQTQYQLLFLPELSTAAQRAEAQTQSYLRRR